MDKQVQDILNSDITQIHSDMMNKMNSLDQLSQCLTEGSSFMVSFQNMLQKQLQNITPKIQSNKITCKEAKQRIKIFFQQLKNIHKQIKSFLVGSNSHLKQSMIGFVSSSVMELRRQIGNRYETKIRVLEGEIEKLKVEKYYLEDIEPLSSATSRQFGNVSDSTMGVFTDRTAVKGQTKWKSYVCQLSKPTLQCVNEQENLVPKPGPKVPSLIKHSANKNRVWDLPSIPIVKVKIPPVQEGFGIHAVDSEIFYRGMWKNGKFQGQGQLSVGSYMYDGMFHQGMMEGKGVLKAGMYEYKGQFHWNQAQGEGILQGGGSITKGRWKNNQLIHRYN